MFGPSDNDDDFPSPSTSPRKNAKPQQSPAKALLAAKKDFQTRKAELATSFLADLDARIAAGRIAELAASTGGVQISWSKKLNSTAGRAHWRREIVKKKSKSAGDGGSAEGEAVVKEIKHFAKIELAEKVIGCPGEGEEGLGEWEWEDRLRNVVAHEFCHLCVFMLGERGGKADGPHGKEFKMWARKTSKAFSHLNIDVTTKHSYEISYKYIWTCQNELCGTEFKRHSKSIHPSRHSCGACKGRLLQTKPVPRAGGHGTTGGSEYQKFVKENFQRIRGELKGEGREGAMGEVMERVGREYREEKARRATKVDEKRKDGLDDVVKAMNIVTLD
ncbi:hypothetical protein K402DRAFT_329958 [Aulographum hederae CBS 113979]|uniref:SprT-like domain-containing protein n=1 Tax=Aulographum hederae CBS 113979 TaxID=1176131 RepID=A0A6G1H3J3_9PEZI|nr:hypothetical protein K402DRAFT_329958 [Aulographum hederae CBS 113979]